MKRSGSADLEKTLYALIDTPTVVQGSTLHGDPWQRVAKKKNVARAFFKSLLLMVAAGLFSTALFAQNASFTGHVADASGAAVPKAKITVVNQQTGQRLTTTTTGAGDYTVPYLKPGVYSVTAEAPGFKKENKVDIGLQVSQVGVIDFRLAVGAVTESVTVNNDEALLDRGKADRGEVVENRRVTELPLNGRNPVMLDRLNSAVIWDGNIIWQRPFDGQVYTNLHVNGSDPGGGANYSTEVMLDGMNNQTPRPQNLGHHDVAYVAPEDSVQDFKIVTNPYDAEYGRTRGGVIDMTLKSGTNSIHGDVYEFARRTWLDADLWINDWLIKDAGASPSQYSTPQHKLDQYGAELDGPVVFPKLFNGRDKLFFVAQVENWNEIEPATLLTSVPEPAWASGNFNGLTYNGQAVTIYNPYSTYTNSKGQVSRNVFPNNQIPPAMLNPVAQKILTYYPQPNTETAPGTPWQNNFYTQTPTVDKYRNALVKLDWNVSSQDRFSIRYGYWERYETDNGTGIPGPAEYGEYPLGDRAHTFGTEWTHTFSPQLLLDFRAAVAVKAEIGNTGPTGFDSTALGWPASLVSQFGNNDNMFPGMSPSGFASLGTTFPNYGSNSLTTSDSLNLFPSLTWLKGKHNIRAGLDLRFYQYAIKLNADTGVSFKFDQTWTQNCWSCSAGSDYSGAETTEGNSIASMLLGSAASGSAAIAPQAFYSAPYYAPFIQDDWKVTPRLTLNLGLRYDLQPYYLERHNRANYAFDTTTPNPANALLPTHVLPNGQAIDLVGGVTFLGVNGNPRRIYSTSMYDIQPRVGFAYGLTNKIVVRAGFGEVFQNSDAFPIQQGFSSSTNYSSSPNGGQTPIDNFANPFTSIVQPSGSSLGLLTNLGNGQSYINPNFKIPNVWQFSAGFEEQLSRNDTLEMSYVGNRAPNNETSQNINHESGAAMALCNIQVGGRHEVCDDNYPQDPTAVLGHMTNPFYNVAPFNGSSDYTSTTLQGLQFTEPMPEFGGVTEYQWNAAHSWYNSLQVTVMHRWTNHLTLHGTWTWSKMMDVGGYNSTGYYTDNNYLIARRNLDGADRTHAVTISGVYDLPVGRGRMFLGNTNRIVDGVLGGWELAGLSVIQSGVPFGLPGGWDQVGPAKLAHPYWTSGGNLQWMAPCYYATNAETGAITPTAPAVAFGCTKPDFIQIPSYGATPNVVYTGVRQPMGLWMDSNLSKNFSITERFKLQTRLEAFNVLNHPLWQNGFYTGTSQFSGQVGSATGSGQSNKPRNVQLGVKLSW